MKGRVRGGKRWIDEHVADRFVQRAQASGYRSRAAFKLIELDERDRLLRPGQLVVDLGAAPGSWSQVAAERVGARGEVIAIDLLPIDPIPRVVIRQGDFGDDAVLGEVKALVAGRLVDLVLSDMAPNITGIAATDAARAIRLAELALEFAEQCLKPEGDFVVKVFQGVGFTEFLAQMRREFRRVEARKPDASRGRSSETFLVGRGFRQGVGTID